MIKTLGKREKGLKKTLRNAMPQENIRNHTDNDLTQTMFQKRL